MVQEQAEVTLPVSQGTDAPLPKFDLAHAMLRVKRLHPTLTDEQLAVAEQQYREYMLSVKNDPRRKMQPQSTLVDDIWHTHIYLCTRQYAADCEEYFGYFLHHAAICDGGGCSHDFTPTGDLVGDLHTIQ